VIDRIINSVRRKLVSENIFQNFTSVSYSIFTRMYWSFSHCEVYWFYF